MERWKGESGELPGIAQAPSLGPQYSSRNQGEGLNMLAVAPVHTQTQTWEVVFALQGSCLLATRFFLKGNSGRDVERAF